MAGAILSSTYTPKGMPDLKPTVYLIESAGQPGAALDAHLARCRPRHRSLASTLARLREGARPSAI